MHQYGDYVDCLPTANTLLGHSIISYLPEVDVEGHGVSVVGHSGHSVVGHSGHVRVGQSPVRKTF